MRMCVSTSVYRRAAEICCCFESGAMCKNASKSVGAETGGEREPLVSSEASARVGERSAVASENIGAELGASVRSGRRNHYDPSGMSYRGTSKLGAELFGDGQFEGSPAEMDPKGGSVGLETPYFELPPPTGTSYYRLGLHSAESRDPNDGKMVSKSAVASTE